MVSSKTITILSTATCLLTLISLGITASHSVSYSYVKYKVSGAVIKTLASIHDCPPAVKLKAEDNDKITIISCPYSPITKVIALISLILCQILLILVCCKLKNRVKSITIVIFAIIDLGLLLAGGILMIDDMIKGMNRLSTMPNYSYHPLEFIINILFIFSGMICEGLATYFVLTYKPPICPYEPIDHENTSISEAKPHWNEEDQPSPGPNPQENMSESQDDQYENDSVSNDNSSQQ